MKGFIIGAAGSGSGKTTLCLALLACFADKGYQVAPFKIGPDFIDPGHHRAMTGKNSCNLDAWMLPRDYNLERFHRHAGGADIAVVEGVMGLFDGYDALTETGSTAQMAKWLDLDVVLVVDAKGMARSAAALVRGFETFDPDLNIAGVIFTRVGSRYHYDCLKTAVEKSCNTRCLGYLPHNSAIELKERHLGLVTAQENPVSDAFRSELVHMVDQFIDIKLLMDTLEKIPPVPVRDTLVQSSYGMHPRIAVARDKAFCFYYPENLSFLEKFGAQIVEFSPLTDPDLPENIHGLYLGGGYPELFAEQLSGQRELLAQIRERSAAGMPIYAECGGFMYLCDRLLDLESQNPFQMAGVFPFTVTTGKKLKALGYREITLKQDTVIGRKGTTLRGHEFHYSFLDDPSGSTMTGNDPVQDVFSVHSRDGQDILMRGYQKNLTLGSYFHVHFGSNPAGAEQFVTLCDDFKKKTGQCIKPCRRKQ